MRLVILLLLVQLAYITTKSIENQSSCNDSTDNEPQLRKTEEIDTNTEITDKTVKDPEDRATRKRFSEENNENGDDLDRSNNDNENTNEYASNPSTLPKKIPLVSNVLQFPANIEKGGNVTNKLITNDAPREETVYYRAIDPKYLIVSGLSLPKVNKNVTGVSKTGEAGTPLEESKTTRRNNENNTKMMNVSKEGLSNDNGEKEIAMDDLYADVTNIRELREHLLDHLLDYFINIIKEENLFRNNTRKNNGKDRMKVEDKLRNYYDPHHLDGLIVDDDDNYDDFNYNGNDSEEDLIDDVEELHRKNLTIFYPFKVITDEINKHVGETLESLEDTQELPLNLEENLNSGSDLGSFNATLPEPVTSENIDLTEQENHLSSASSNTTEQSEDGNDRDMNLITTTERSFSNEALDVQHDDDAAEIDMELLNYSEEVATDKEETVFNHAALVVNDYTSYEDPIDSDELQVTRNITVHENEIHPIVDTEENRRRGLGEEVSIANATLDETVKEEHSPILKNNTTNSTSKDDKDGETKKLVNLDQPNKNIDSNVPYNEDNFIANKKRKSTKKMKHGNEWTLTRNTNCGKLIKRNKNHKRHNCRKSLVLNLNINLI